MRVYGRTYDIYGKPTWNVVETAPDGLNDMVYVTALIQALKLNLGESPFYANYGIPAHQSVVQQVAPDYYTMFLQRQYAEYFTSLTITKTNQQKTPEIYEPTYQVDIITHQGKQIVTSISV